MHANNNLAYLPAQTEVTSTICDPSTPENEYDEDKATFTFSMLMPIVDCPEDIRSWDSPNQWKFLSNAVQNWHPV